MWSSDDNSTAPPLHWRHVNSSSDKWPQLAHTTTHSQRSMVNMWQPHRPLANPLSPHFSQYPKSNLRTVGHLWTAYCFHLLMGTTAGPHQLRTIGQLKFMVLCNVGYWQFTQFNNICHNMLSLYWGINKREHWGEGKDKNKHIFEIFCQPNQSLYLLYIPSNQESTPCRTLFATTQHWTNYSLCFCIFMVLMLRMIIKQNTKIVILTLFPQCPISFYIFDNTLPFKLPEDRRSNFTQVWKVMENYIIQQTSCPSSVPWFMTMPG